MNPLFKVLQQGGLQPQALNPEPAGLAPLPTGNIGAGSSPLVPSDLLIAEGRQIVPQEQADLMKQGMSQGTNWGNLFRALSGNQAGGTASASTAPSPARRK